MSISGSKTSFAMIRLYHLQVAALVIITLYIGKSLLIPFALAILLTFILSPAVDRIERYAGRVMAISLVTGLLALFITGLGFMLSHQLNGLAQEIPRYKSNIEKRLTVFDVPQNSTFNQLFQSFTRLKKRLPGASDGEGASQEKMPVKVVESSSTGFTSTLADSAFALLDFLTTAGLVLVLAIFMLFTREDLRGRLIKLVGTDRISSTTTAINDANRRVSQYLVSQVLINFCYGLCIGIGLYFIGLPNALLWATLAFLLRFIPYVGIWVAALMPFVLAMGVFPGWTSPLLVFLLFVLLDLVTANIIEPLLFASHTGISSLALILTAVFWTLVWGPVGLFLSTPLTVCILVIGHHLPQLSFLQTLLGDDKGMALYEKFYKCLLAADFKTARELMVNHLKKGTLPELYDSTILPALSAMEVDKKNLLIDQFQSKKILGQLEQILEDLPAMVHGKPKPLGKSRIRHPIRALCLAPPNESDQLANLMLNQVLKNLSVEATTLSDQASEADIPQIIVDNQINLACLSLVSIDQLPQIQASTKQLSTHFPDIKVVIGLWGSPENKDSMQSILKEAGADVIVFSFQQLLGEFGKASEVKV